MNGYDLIHWEPDETSGQRRLSVVGNYNLTKKEILIKVPIKWNNNSVSIINFSHTAY